MKKALYLLLVFSLLGFASCSSDDNDNSIDYVSKTGGKWIHQKGDKKIVLNMVNLDVSKNSGTMYFDEKDVNFHIASNGGYRVDADSIYTNIEMIGYNYAYRIANGKMVLIGKGRLTGKTFELQY